VTSPLYVKWGIKQHDNEQLRQKYIREALPEIRKLGLTPADNDLGRRFT
jgi:1,2-phenylacetyl-CoA epoxidase catalytic subunit